MSAAREAIVEAVGDWALWRDTGRWDRLRGLYTPDAIQHTTWFVGPATQFIEHCMRSKSRSQHFVGACSVELNGERAIAETRLVLLVRGVLQGVEVDVTCHGRSYDRFVRWQGAWRIARREMIYEKDRMDPVDPSAALKLDAAELARYPAGYRHLATLQASGGQTITPDLPIPGSDALARLYEEGERWLRGSSPQP